VYSCYILLLALFKCRYNIRGVQSFLNLTMFVKNIIKTFVSLNKFILKNRCNNLSTDTKYIP
jgi:hypothetical protein